MKLNDSVIVNKIKWGIFKVLLMSPAFTLQEIQTFAVSTVYFIDSALLRGKQLSRRKT